MKKERREGKRKSQPKVPYSFHFVTKCSLCPFSPRLKCVVHEF